MTGIHDQGCAAVPVVERLNALLTERVGGDPRTVSASATDLGFDSVDFVILLTVAKEEFGYQLSFPGMDLQQVALPELVVGLTRPICDCTHRV